MDHTASHDHKHNHGDTDSHTHSHAPASPHPEQTVPWSILRMTVTARVSAAIAVSAGLWGIVLLAMR